MFIIIDKYRNNNINDWYTVKIIKQVTKGNKDISCTYVYKFYCSKFLPSYLYIGISNKAVQQQFGHTAK